jgi:hypothetical protein
LKDALVAVDQIDRHPAQSDQGDEILPLFPCGGN